MQGQHNNQSSFFGMIYEELIPAAHLLHTNMVNCLACGWTVK